MMSFPGQISSRVKQLGHIIPRAPIAAQTLPHPQMSTNAKLYPPPPNDKPPHLDQTSHQSHMTAFPIPYFISKAYQIFPFISLH